MNSRSLNNRSKSNEMPLPGIVLWLPVALAFTISAIQILAPDSRSVYWITLLVLSAVSLFTLARCVFTPVLITPWEFFAGALGGLYGIGTLNTELSAIGSSRDLAMLTSAPASYVHMTIGYTTMLVACLLVLGRFSTFRPFALVDARLLNGRVILALASLTTLACIALIATNKIGYHGDLSEEFTKPSSVATLAVVLAGPIAGLTVYAWCNLSHRAKWLAAAIMLLQFCVHLYLGRRNVVFTGLVCTMAYFASLASTRILTRQSVTLIAVGILAFPVITHGFMAMRLASYESSIHGERKPSPALILEKTWDLVVNDTATIAAKSDENLSERTFIIGYLSELTWKTSIQAPLYGEVLKLNVGMAIPRAIWPAKFRSLKYSTDEVLANPELGLPITDAANSLLTAGMTDFGLLGMICYPIGMIALLMAGVRLGRHADPLVCSLLILMAFITIANVESTLTTYLIALRLMFLFGVAGIALHWALSYLANYNMHQRVRRSSSGLLKGDC